MPCSKALQLSKQLPAVLDTDRQFCPSITLQVCIPALSTHCQSNSSRTGKVTATRSCCGSMQTRPCLLPGLGPYQSLVSHGISSAALRCVSMQVWVFCSQLELLVEAEVPSLTFCTRRDAPQWSVLSCSTLQYLWWKVINTNTDRIVAGVSQKPQE